LLRENIYLRIENLIVSLAKSDSLAQLGEIGVLLPCYYFESNSIEAVMKLSLEAAVKIISPYPMAFVFAATCILVPNTAEAQNERAIKSCIDSLMYEPNTYPQTATGISAEVAAIACQNQTASSNNVAAIRNCINSLMFKPNTYPQTATGISAEVAAIACQNQTASSNNVEAIRSCINSLRYQPNTYPQTPTGMSAEAAAKACQNAR
jgi:hypothetical protein